MKIVLRIGGSILGSPPASEAVSAFADTISDLTNEGNQVAVIVGGGEIAREYIRSASQMGLSSFQQDTIAIHASRLNARLVSMKMGGISSIPSSVDGLLRTLAKNRVAVMGGLKPGITTDTVAALVAQAWRADLMIKASDQEGVYTGDPRHNKKAKLLRTMSYEKLSELLAGVHKPGIHSIIDPVAILQLTKYRVKLVVLNGKRPRGVYRAAHGEEIGTLVT